jgi:hypothetical protein
MCPPVRIGNDRHDCVSPVITGWVKNEIGEAQVMSEGLGRYKPRSMERLKWFTIKNMLHTHPIRQGCCCWV